MIRDISFVRDGNSYNIKAIACPEIFDFEILVPESYRIIYRGLEGAFAIDTHSDIDIDCVNKCDNYITIVNLNPSIVKLISLKNDDEAVEFLKYVVANCSMIGIELDNNKQVIDIVLHYQCDCELAPWQIDYVIEPDLGFNIVRKEY